MRCKKRAAKTFFCAWLRNIALRVDRKLISHAIDVGRFKHLTYLGIMIMALVLFMMYFVHFPPL